MPVPVDVFVRSEADRERRNCEPRSVTDEAMECLLVWLRLCGVEGTLGGNSYWLVTRGGASGSVAEAGSRLRAGGGVLAAVAGRERDEAEALCLERPPKMEGRLEKRPVDACVVVLAGLLFLGCELEGSIGSLGQSPGTDPKSGRRYRVGQGFDG